MLLLVTACSLTTSPGGTDEQLESGGRSQAAATPSGHQIRPDRLPAPREPLSSASTIGRTFRTRREACDRYEAQGFVLQGRFENGEWPATVVYEKEAVHAIHVVLKNGQPHGYPGNDGYRMKAVALEDQSGGETMLVFRSRERACAPGAGPSPSNPASTRPAGKSRDPNRLELSCLLPGVSVSLARDLDLIDEFSFKGLSQDSQIVAVVASSSGAYPSRGKRLALVADGKTRRISWPSDLIGSVRIQTRRQALEFVRLFSSPDNSFHTPEFGFMEVRSSLWVWGRGAIAPPLLKKWSLPQVQVLGDGEKFRIRRPVVRMWPPNSRRERHVFVGVLDERVWPDGRYERVVLWERPVYARLLRWSPVWTFSGCF